MTPIDYWQPLSGLGIGLLILAFVGYMNWFGTTKRRTIEWIARRAFHNEFNSQQSADGMFMVATSILLAIGWIMVGVSLLYLSN
jgi:hypothetical protein